VHFLRKNSQRKIRRFEEELLEVHFLRKNSQRKIRRFEEELVEVHFLRKNSQRQIRRFDEELLVEAHFLSKSSQRSLRYTKILRIKIISKRINHFLEIAIAEFKQRKIKNVRFTR
jgi:hypothetical protein